MTPRITLPPAEFFRLRYLQTCAERDAAAAEVLALRAAAQAAQTAAAFTAALSAAGFAHDFDPAVPYGWDDPHTALVPSTDAPASTDPR